MIGRQAARTGPLALARPLALHLDPRRPAGRLMACAWCSCGRFWTETLHTIARTGSLACPACGAGGPIREADAERAFHAAQAREVAA